MQASRLLDVYDTGWSYLPVIIPHKVILTNFSKHILTIPNVAVV